MRLVELAEEALKARSFEEFTEDVLPVVAGMMQSRSALLYVSDSRLPAPYFFQHGFQPEAVSGMKNLCAEQFDHISGYCKQRQGQASCKGCKRPLGVWTPCVKYRETSV